VLELATNMTEVLGNAELLEQCDAVIMVRPDGFVAWRSASATPDPAAELGSPLRDLMRSTALRKVINSTYMSLDGVVTNPQEWTFEFRDDTANAVAFEQLMASDALLMGRKTYGIFSEVWPTMKDEGGFANKMNSMPKHVASRTLKETTWNATVIEGDLVEAVDKLKRESGQDILQYGYGPVTGTLIEHGLLDELRLWLHPILVGRGEVDDLLIAPRAKTTLRLADLKKYDSGLLILTYQPLSR
jgi:dihydrofolate reductase